MDWAKKHIDTVMILSAIAGMFFWIDGKFERVDARFCTLERDMSKIEKDLGIVKAVLMMKDILPRELAVNDKGDVK